MKLSVAAAVILLIGGVIGLLSMGAFGVSLICILLLMFSAPFLAIFAGWAALSLKRTGGVPRTAKVLLAVFAGFSALLGTIVLSGFASEKYFVSQAMNFPGRIAPAMEQYRREHGRCPDSLQALAGIPPVPRLLRGEGSYRSEGEFYSLEFNRPSAFFEIMGYSSETGRWISFD
jgi:hypothetical protein